jgi:hypothetical protein
VLVGGIKPSPSAAATAAATAPTAGTWYDKLWGTVKSADHPVVKPTSAAPLAPPVLTASPTPITVSPSPGGVR